jgi:hypothetical protein
MAMVVSELLYAVSVRQCTWKRRAARRCTQDTSKWMGVAYDGDGRVRTGVSCERETVYVKKERGATVYTRRDGVDGDDVQR